jgi:NAD(P)-dependent dehydrogenase (short-subunit alcohol dehydrogenase family)
VNQQGRLSGKTAVVTGGTEGIGAAVSRAFVGEGASVVLVARRSQLGERILAELGREHARFVPGDVSLPETAAAAMEASQEFGALDILVNNAGLELSGIDVVEYALDDARRVFDVNFFGALRMLQLAVHAMDSRGGSIINITSRTASVGVAGMAVYSASKGALASLTRSAAVELAPSGIRVNAVAPGLTETPPVRAWIDSQQDPAAFRATLEATIPQRRFAEAADVAAAVVYLASDEARCVTGTVLAVDCGYTAA